MRFIPERREEKFCDAQKTQISFFLFFEFFSFFLVLFVCLSLFFQVFSFFFRVEYSIIKNLLREEKRCGLVR